MTCPSCRADVPAGARFCPECGQELRLRGDERRIVTVLFADLVGYTALSETRDPESVKNLVDACFERLVADIDAFGGRVDKIIGDGIVALFGAPVAHEDDAERAVRAALRMQETLASHSHDLGAEIRMRVGVNTGEVLVGALRAGGDYTAMGDVVNTANRLQTAAQPGEVLVGASTFFATRRTVTYEERAPIDVKGKEDPVAVWRAAGAAAPPGYRPERDRVPLIGRDAELGLLGQSVENSVRNARATLLLVLGEAGVGKSRLAEELAAITKCDHDALILEGRCVPYGEANVWWPIADALRHGCGIRSSDEEDRAVELARAAVEIALGPEPDGDEVDSVLQGLLFLMGYSSELHRIEPARAREEATAAVVTFAERYSVDRPVVVVLSDLHWADDLVLDLVDTLLERLATRRFVVLATARQLIEERWHPPHGRHNLVVLTLDPLTASAAADLLVELAGSDLGAELEKALLERSGGNPFFLEELVTLLSDAGMVGGSAPASVAELPDTLRGLVAARLDGLTPQERRVLDDCAVLGRRSSMLAIQTMASKHIDIDDVRPIIESLDAKELLTVSGTGDGEKWTFRSDLVREVAYSTLTKADRARSHSGIAVWIEENEELGHEWVIHRIAHHYARAAALAQELGPIDGLLPNLSERALDWVDRAARQAEHGDYPVVAERLFSVGLRLLGGQRGPRHLAFLAGRARALANLRDLGPAHCDATAAVAEGREAGQGHEHELAHAMLVLADVEQKEGRWAESDAVLDDAAEIFRTLGDPGGEAEVLRLRGFGALTRHEYVAATDLLQEALGRFEDLDDRRGVAWALQNLAWCAFYQGRAPEAEALLRRASETFAEIGDNSGLRWAKGLLAWTRFQQGYTEEAGEMAERVLDHDGRSGDRWALGMMMVLAGSVRLWTGRTLSALDRLREAHDLFTDIDDDFGLNQSSAVLGRGLVLAGHVDEGLELVAELGAMEDGAMTERKVVLAVMAGIAATVQIGDTDRTERILSRMPVGFTEDDTGLLVGDTERVTSMTLHRLQRGDVDGALATGLSLVGQLAPEVDPNLSSAVALVLAAVGRVEEALAHADAVDQHPRASYLDKITAGVGRSLALRGGDEAAATASFDQARAAADATEDKVSQALVRLAEATAASARGGSDAAHRQAEADARLVDLGISDTGWRTAYAAALGLTV